MKSSELFSHPEEPEFVETEPDPEPVDAPVFSHADKPHSTATTPTS